MIVAAAAALPSPMRGFGLAELTKSFYRHFHQATTTVPQGGPRRKEAIKNLSNVV